jgi:hypothetical protein
MLPMARFENLQACIADVVDAEMPGDLIETGVWRGGATIFMRGMLKALDVSDRTVWVADSFEGLPEPDPEKFPVEAKTHHGSVMKKAYHHFAVGLDEVRRNFAACWTTKFGFLRAVSRTLSRPRRLSASQSSDSTATTTSRQWTR